MPVPRKPKINKIGVNLEKGSLNKFKVWVVAEDVEIGDTVTAKKKGSTQTWTGTVKKRTLITGTTYKARLHLSAETHSLKTVIADDFGDLVITITNDSNPAAPQPSNDVEIGVVFEGPDP